jgi:hypothetical protein
MVRNNSSDTDDENYDDQELDTAFEVLSHHRRRQILAMLSESGSRGEDYIVAADFEPRNTSSNELMIALHHQHLPMLERAGYIEWHRDSNIIQRGPAFEHIAPVVEILQSNMDVLPGEWP